MADTLIANYNPQTSFRYNNPSMAKLFGLMAK